MATYVNNLRLMEITTGDEDGTWGTKTNTNLELIADAFGSGTEAITTNADTHTTTIADGDADEGRAIFLKYTGNLDSNCTITLAPNTINKLWFIENATGDSGASGPYSIIISQGSGANITIGNGKVAAVYTDGAAGSAAVIDAFADLELSSTLTVAGASTLTGAVTAGAGITVTGTTPTVTIGDAGAEDTKLVFDGNAQDFYMGLDDSADDLVIGLGSTVGTTPAVTIDENQAVVFPAATVTIGDATAEDTKLVFDGNAQDFYVGLDDSADDLVIGVGSTVGTTPALSITEDQDLIMTAAKKLYLDGGGNSYIHEASADSVQTVAGGTTAFGVNSGAIFIPATNKIYLDNGGNTYIHENSADSVQVVTGGSYRLGITDAGIYVAATSKVFFDGGSNTYIYQSSDDNLDVVAGGTTSQSVTATGTSFNDLAITNVSDIALDSVSSDGSTAPLFKGTGSSGATEIGNAVDNAALFINSKTGTSAGMAIGMTSGGDPYLQGCFSDNSGGKTIMLNPYGDNVQVIGALSKGSGSFLIPHPLPSMNDTHNLVHSFVEGPRADLIYRGSVALSGGSASVDLDAEVGMTDGTWELLCRDPQVFLQNEDGWSALKGSVSGSTLLINCENTNSTDTVSWMVVAERQDEHMKESGTDWTDSDGRPILEPLKRTS